MTRYWIIAPYDSRETRIFEKVWEYDLNNGTIAIGWRDLGDVSGMSKPELESKYKEVYGEINNKDINAIWRFYNEISLGDIIISRKGTKKIIGIGTVTGKPFYNEEMGKERVGTLTDFFYPNFIHVKWEKKEIEFDKIVFSFYTLYEISEEKFHSLTKGEIAEERPDEETESEFVLEKYLEDFIISNFDSIFRGKYSLYSDSEGNIGQQYPTEVGNIDILARELESNSYIVIELKKGRESDKVVGQILRYMGWVKENLCREGENVKGLIICKDKDEKLDYALTFVQDSVKVKYYKVNFQLIDPS